MGEHDLLKPVLERALGGTIHFARVSMKPGKPTTFASVEVKDSQSGERTRKLLFSLPGNPASAIVTTAIFALPGLRKLCAMPPASASEKGSADQVAWKKAGLPRIKATLTQSVRCDQSREEYVRVSVRALPDGFVAETTGGQRSSRIGSVAGANGLAMLPAGGGTYEEGRKVDVVMIGDIVW
jgi:gephyrin